MDAKNSDCLQDKDYNIEEKLIAAIWLHDRDRSSKSIGNYSKSIMLLCFDPDGIFFYNSRGYSKRFRKTIQ